MTNFLSEEGMIFVGKNDHPASVPEERPVEDFWAHLKGIFYAKGWHEENYSKPINKIKYCLRKLDPVSVQHLATTTFKRIDLLRRSGVV